MYRRISWTQLTRFGIPEFTLSRALTITGGVKSEPGTRIGLADLALNKLRGLYERRMIEPFIADETAVPPVQTALDQKSTAKPGRRKKD